MLVARVHARADEHQRTLVCQTTHHVSVVATSLGRQEQRRERGSRRRSGARRRHPGRAHCCFRSDSSRRRGPARLATLVPLHELQRLLLLLLLLERAESDVFRRRVVRRSLAHQHVAPVAASHAHHIVLRAQVAVGAQHHSHANVATGHARHASTSGRSGSASSGRCSHRRRGGCSSGSGSGASCGPAHRSCECLHDDEAGCWFRGVQRQRGSSSRLRRVSSLTVLSPFTSHRAASHPPCRSVPLVSRQRRRRSRRQRRRKTGQAAGAQPQDQATHSPWDAPRRADLLRARKPHQASMRKRVRTVRREETRRGACGCNFTLTCAAVLGSRCALCVAVQLVPSPPPPPLPPPPPVPPALQLPLLLLRPPLRALVCA